MFDLGENQYDRVQSFLKNKACETASADSIIDNPKRGRILVDNIENPESVLFWNYSGYAILAGSGADEAFNQNVAKILSKTFEENQRKIGLVIDDPDWNKKISRLTQNHENLNRTNRLRFKFDEASFRQRAFEVPDGYELKTIDESTINRIEGTMIPGRIWDSAESFLANGKGFCIMDAGNVVCAAFAAYIVNGKVDIALETAMNYRQRGLGTITAAAVVTYALEKGLEPVWGCAETNPPSFGVAKNLGFKLVDSHPYYMTL